MRINQASQIISEYSNNIKAVYGQDFMFSEAAIKLWYLNPSIQAS